MSAAATVAHDHDIRPPAGHGKLRVLLVEDNSADIELVSRELRRGGFDLTIDVVETEEEFTARVRSNSYQVVLDDYNLPQWRGLEALNVLRNEKLDIPLILVSGALGDVSAVECIKQGAMDYVLKDRLARLELRRPESEGCPAFHCATRSALPVPAIGGGCSRRALPGKSWIVLAR